MNRAVIGLVTVLAMAGCAVPGTAAPPPSVPVTAPTSNRVELAITLADGKAEPGGERLEVAVGTTVAITVTSDREDEVHVHGYDLELPVSPGTPITREFLADRTGSFEIESHEPALLIVQLLVR